MANQVIIDKSKLTSIGDAIRSKTGGTSNLTVDQMASEIDEKMVVPSATKGATTYTPETSNQTIAAGTFLTGKITIKGDADLKAENIKKGVKIFSVTGTYETPIDLDDITTMSWQQLSELSSKGIDLSGCLGQTKDITVSGSTISARLVSMKYNGSKGYVFMTNEVLPTQYKMQTNTTTKTSGGWANTTFKTALEGTIFNSINSDLRSYMKSITIPYSSGSGNHIGDTISTLNTNIFIPSVKELKGANGSYTSTAEGAQFDYFANGGSFAVGNNFLTRTRTTINQFAYFPANSETAGQLWFNTSAYVLFCFVI